MASSGFAISITAVDSATQKIDALNKRLSALKAPAENLQKSFKKLGELSGITKGWDKLHKGIETAHGALSKFVPLIGELTAVGAIAALSMMVKTWTDFAQQLSITAAWLGMMPSKVQQMQNAMRLMGGSAEDATKSFEALDDSLQDAVAGRSPETMRLFAALGIDIHKTTLEAKSASEIMPELFDKIQKFQGNPAELRRLANALHISPAMFALARKEGAAGLARMQAEAAKHGLLSDPEVSKLAVFKEHLTGLQEAVENFGARIAIGLTPKLQPLIDRFEKWMDDGDNVKKVTDGIVDVVGRLIDFVGSATDFIIKLFKAVNPLVDAMGGWEHVLEGIIALKLLGWVTDLIAPIGRLTSGLLAMSAAAVPLAAVGAIAGVYMADKANKQSFDERAFGMGYTQKGGSWPNYTYTNPQTGETLSYAEMLKKQNIDQYTGQPKVATPAADITVPPEGRALLDTIAQPESGGDYHKQYGGADIDDLSHHPGTAITAGGYTSTAFGKYQFLKSTWDDEQRKLGLKDMSPGNQDKAAWDLANTKYKAFTGRDLATDLKDPMMNTRITRALHGIWTSLPGGSQNPTGQGTFDLRLAANEAAQLKQVAQAPATKIDGNITANVNVNAPEGTKVTATSSGAVAPPTVAMPMMGYGAS